MGTDNYTINEGDGSDNYVRNQNVVSATNPVRNIGNSSLNYVRNVDGGAKTWLELVVKSDNTGSSNNDQFTIPLFTGETYNFDYEDDDGNSGTHNTDSDLTLTFPSGAGTYVIKIGVNGNNTFPRMYFNNGGDKSKLLDVTNWGETVYTSWLSAWRGCNNAQFSATDAPDLSLVTTLQNAMAGMTTLTSSLNHWDVSTITLMGGMMDSGGNPDISGWRPVALTNISNGFRFNSNFNRSLNAWVTPNLTGFSVVFFFASSYDQPMGNIDITGVSSMTQLCAISGLTNASLDPTLIGFESQAVKDNVTVDFGSAKYCSQAAINALDALVADHSWVILSGGLCTSTLQDTDGNTLQDTSANSLQDTN